MLPPNNIFLEKINWFLSLFPSHLNLIQWVLSGDRVLYPEGTLGNMETSVGHT